MQEIQVRVAKVTDAERLLEIYAPYVENTAITFEYEVPTLQEFQQRIEKTLKKYPYLVAEQDGVVAGYAYAGAFHAREAYDWAVETSIYVDKRKKKSGIGKRLHNSLEQVLREQGILNMNACIAYTPVAEEHLTNDSVYFHQHMGYRMVGEFYQCGYKFHHWYNMVWMEKHIGEHKEIMSPVIPFSQISFTN